LLSIFRLNPETHSLLLTAKSVPGYAVSRTYHAC